VISANSLNVRGSPSTLGETLGALKKGDAVVFSPVSKEWAMIYYNGRLGYISTQYVTPTGLIAADENEEACEVDYGNTSLRAEVTDFKCREGLFVDSGYERCDIEVNVNLQSSCSGDGNANVYCEATLNYRDTEDFLDQRGRADTSEPLYISAGSAWTQFEIRWKPSFQFNPIVSVRLKDVSCQLETVSGY